MIWFNPFMFRRSTNTASAESGAVRMYVAAQDGTQQSAQTRMLSALLLVAVVWLAGCAGTPPAPLQSTASRAPGEYSHAAWQRVVEAHVSGAQVNYPGIAAEKQFPAYIVAVAGLDPAALPTRDARLAFLINAYNALVVQGVLDGYTATSFWGRYRFFLGDAHIVGGQYLNLYDIERRIILPQFDDPRVHFALAYPSRSSPQLQPWAYDGADVERQLDEAARIFLNDPEKNRFDRTARVAYLSPIFNWFAEEFIQKGGSVIQYIKPYLNDPTLVKDLEHRPYRIEYLDFDWTLNGPPHP